MATSDVIAVIALAVSVISVGFAWGESKRRKEEVGILRMRFEARQQAESMAKHAHIVIDRRIPVSGSSHAIQYIVSVQNVGESIATEVAVDLVGANRKSAGRRQLDRALLANESGKVAVLTPPHDGYFGPYDVYVEWTDGRGRIRGASGWMVGPP